MKHKDIFNKYKRIGPSGIDKHPFDMSKTELTCAAHRGIFGPYSSNLIGISDVLNKKKSILFVDFSIDLKAPHWSDYRHVWDGMMKRHPELDLEILYTEESEFEGHKFKAMALAVFRKDTPNIAERIQDLKLLYEEENYAEHEWDILFGAIMDYTIDDLALYFKRIKVVTKINNMTNKEKQKRYYAMLEKVDAKHCFNGTLSERFPPL